jgi:hypothetical protein
MKLCRNTHAHPEHDDEHMWHANARGQRANIGASRFLRQLVGQPGIVTGAEKHHQAGRRQDAAEDDLVRYLQHKAQERRQRQHVDQDVGSESEKRIHVSGCP